MIYEIWKDWHECREYILPALEYCHGSHNEDDVLALLAAGQYKLWRGEGCAVVTGFIQYPRFKAMNTIFAGGDLDGLRALQPGMETWARVQGCGRVIGGGRPGWGKVFTDYAPLGTLYYKDL